MHDPIDPSPITEIHLPITGRRNGRHKQVIAYATVLNDGFTLDTLTKHSWHLSSTGYPRTKITLPSGRKKIFFLHQLVFENYRGPLPANHEVDHANRNKLDATPSNLRAATRSLQRANTPVRRDNKLGLKGIHEHTLGRNTYYLAEVVKNFKRVLYKLFPHTPQGLQQAIAAHREAYQTHYPEVTLDPVSHHKE